MSHITLQVLDGADRGVVYDQVTTPITIGREEGNGVQLNDERISRFHIKIQEDQNKVVLTDLDSTNGTRVNGQATQLRILQYGDLIAVGRSTLLYGTRQQIAGRVDQLKANGVNVGDSSMLDQMTRAASSINPNESISIQLQDDFDLDEKDDDSEVEESEFDWGNTQQFPSTLHMPGPPELPEGLGPAQSAQLSEILEYFHLRSRALLHGVIVKDGKPVTIDQERWQELLDLQGQLAQYLRHIANPDSE